AFGACATNEKPKNIRWDTTTILPPNGDGSNHIGIAGPITGIIGDKLLIAGGANFPDKMPWDGGTKHYATQAYLYQITDNGLEFLQQQELQDTNAYAGSCSAQGAIYFAGGENTTGVQSAVKKLTLVEGRLMED